MCAGVSNAEKEGWMVLNLAQPSWSFVVVCFLFLGT